MISKNFKLICLLVVIGIAVTSVAYAFIYETKTQSVTQTIKKAWYDQNWQYRKQITINYTKVSANLIDFPVLISLSSDANLASHARSDGWDIVFTSSDKKTKLNHELEKYNSTTGNLVAWVKVPTISSTSNTVLYMYYGNPTSSNQQNCAGVWSSYVAVYHFMDGSGSKITDSTLQNNSTLYGGGSHWTSGQIGGAYNFDGINDYAVITASTAFDKSTYTIEAWAKPNTPQAWADIMGQNNTTNGPTKFQFAAGSASTNLASDFGANNAWHTLEAVGALSNNAWNSYTDRIDMANTNQSLWKNGIIVASQTQTAYPCTYANGSAIGIGADAFGAYKFKGTIDELRFSSIALSANWIKTEYNNQKDPSTFYSVALEMTK
jgi:hypothetical protein